MSEDTTLQDVAAALNAKPGQLSGMTGAGVTIGIISGSFDVQDGPEAVARDQANGLLPNGDNLKIARQGPASGDEGRAMAELVHAIAPGAKIVFASDCNEQGVSSLQTHAEAVEKLVNAGCTVIADDVSEQGEPLWQANADPLQKAVASAISQGVSYFHSAGNLGIDYYAGKFRPETATLAGKNGVRADDFGHELTTIAVRTGNNLGAGGSASFTVSWNEAEGLATSDLSLELVDDKGHRISAWAHHETGEPCTTVDFAGLEPDTSYHLAVVDASKAKDAPAGLDFRIVSSRDKLNFTGNDRGHGQGSFTGLSNVPGVNMVGQIGVADTPWGGRAIPKLTQDTAGGAHTIDFAPDGTVLDKPEQVGGNPFCGLGGADTSVDIHGLPGQTGMFPFWGTSAATPTVAAVAALIQSVDVAKGLTGDAALNRADITNLLKDSAVVACDPDQRNRSGYAGAGLVQADKAVQFATSNTITAYDNEATPKTRAGAAEVTRTGNTTLYGTHLGDTFVSDDRADTFVIEGGDNTLKGNGMSTVSYADVVAGGVTVDLTTGTARRADGDVDKLRATPNLVGSNNGDTVSAASGDHTITTGAGANAVTLGTGRTELKANGTDVVTAGSGAVSIDVQHAPTIASQPAPGTATDTQSVRAAMGSAADLTVMAGQGRLDIRGGQDTVDVVVQNGHCGGVINLHDYCAARDHVDYQGFGSSAVASTDKHANGNVTVTLTDHTVINMMATHQA